MRTLNYTPLRFCFLVAVAFAASFVFDPMRAAADDPFLLINEIYFDPPTNSLDNTQEFIELRGTPDMSLENHYLIMIENESSTIGLANSGVIETIFDLGATDALIGGNGFLTIRQKNNPYSVANSCATSPAPCTTDLVNSGSGGGFGSGAGSSVSATNQSNTGRLENGGFTAWLVHDQSEGGVNKPTLNFDLDLNDDGLDIETGRDGWSVLDAIAFTEPGEAYFARYYAPINFGFESPDLNPESEAYFNPQEHMEEGAVYVALGYEVEYLGRWGNSTGHTEADWHISNLTNDAGSGYPLVGSPPAYRQSCSELPGCHPAVNGVNEPPPLGLQTESNQDVPYGTILNNTLGRPNFLTGDYNKDGYVNAADYTVWRNTVGQQGSDAADLPADGNHDYAINMIDYAIWKSHYGQPLASAAGASVEGSQVPEPTSCALAFTALTCLLVFRKRK